MASTASPPPPVVKSERVLYFQALEARQLQTEEQGGAPLRAVLLVDGIEQDSTSTSTAQSQSGEITWPQNQGFSLPLSAAHQHCSNIALVIRNEKRGTDIGQVAFSLDSLLASFSPLTAPQQKQQQQQQQQLSPPVSVSVPVPASTESQPAPLDSTSGTSTDAGSSDTAHMSHRRTNSRLSATASAGDSTDDFDDDVLEANKIRDEWLFLDSMSSTDQSPAKVHVEVILNNSLPRSVQVRIIECQLNIAKVKHLYLSVKLQPSIAPVGAKRPSATKETSSIASVSSSNMASAAKTKTFANKEGSPVAVVGETFSYVLQLPVESHWLELSLFEPERFSGDTLHAVGQISLAHLTPLTPFVEWTQLEKKVDKKKEKVDKNKKSNAFGLGTLHVAYSVSENIFLPLDFYQDLLKLFIPGHVGENKIAAPSVPTSKFNTAAARRRRSSVFAGNYSTASNGSDGFTLTAPALLNFASKCAEARAFSDSVMAVLETQDLALPFLRAAFNIEVTSFLAAGFKDIEASSADKNTSTAGAGTSGGGGGGSNSSSGVGGGGGGGGSSSSGVSSSSGDAAPLPLLSETSVAAHFFESYMRVTGKHYVYSFLQPFIKELANNASFAWSKTGEDAGGTIKRNWKSFEAFVRSLIDTIVGSLDECPHGLRIALRELYSLSLERFSIDQSAARAAQAADKIVNELVFARFICEAMERPWAYGLHLGNEKVSKALLLVARILHTIADTNYMKDSRDGLSFASSSFVSNCRAKVRKFVSSLATGDVSQDNSEMSGLESTVNSSHIELERELANIHRIFRQSLDAVEQPESSTLAQSIAVMSMEAPGSAGNAGDAAFRIGSLGARASVRLGHVIHVLSTIDDNINCALVDPATFLATTKSSELMFAAGTTGSSDGALLDALHKTPPTARAAEMNAQNALGSSPSAAILAAELESGRKSSGSSSAFPPLLSVSEGAAETGSGRGYPAAQGQDAASAAASGRIGQGTEFNNRLETLIDEIVEGVRKLKQNADQGRKESFVHLASELADSVGKVVGLIDALLFTDVSSRGRVVESREFLCDNMIVLRQAAHRATTVTQHREVAVQYMIDSAFVVIKTLKTLTQTIDALDPEAVKWTLDDSHMGRFSAAFSQTLARKVRGKKSENGSGDLSVPASALNRRFSKSVSPSTPPTGRVSLVFTDIENSSALWERDPVLTRTAVKMHNVVMRDALRVCDGYEVKTEGDAFMVAFQRAIDAVKFCLTVQTELLSVAWPKEILGMDNYKPVLDEDVKLVFNGLRVRMGIHTGEPDCEPDPITHRMDYFGPVVNRAARVSSVASGGQVVISSSAYEDTKPALDDIKSFNPMFVELGSFKLKGLGNEEMLFQVLPSSLMGRKFAPKATSQPANEGSENVKLVFNLMLDKQTAEVPPPTGHMAIVFADVQNALQLWHTVPEAMRPSIKLYKDFMRRSLRVNKGYEVKSEGDAFMVAFQKTSDAARWCLEVQLGLLALEWPSELIDSQYCWERRSPDGALLQRGLSIRMGLHSGTPESEMDPFVERTDYFGPMVNRAARVSEAADGGQVVLSSAAHSDVAKDLKDGAFASFSPSVIELGEYRIKELDTVEKLVQLLPASLAGRIFKKLPTEYEKFRPSVKARQHLADLLGELGSSGADTVYPAPSRSTVSRTDSGTTKLQRTLTQASLGAVSQSSVGSEEGFSLHSRAKSMSAATLTRRAGSMGSLDHSSTLSKASSQVSMLDTLSENAELSGDKCGGCGEVVDEEGDETWLLALGKKWHFSHFACRKCKTPFEETPYIPYHGHPYCEKDYYMYCAKKCAQCLKPIVGETLIALESHWHPECFNCDACSRSLKNEDYFGRNGKPYCEKDFSEKFLVKCKKCSKFIEDEVITALGAKWHLHCFVCRDCKKPLAEQTFYAHGDSPRCQNCTLQWVMQPKK